MAESPVSSSTTLLRVSEEANALARVYGRGPLRGVIGSARWHFRWRSLRESLTGVELRLRIGGGEIAVLLEDLAPFGSAVDVMHAGLPPALRAAYLNALAAPVWRELETLTQRAVQLVDFEAHSTMSATPECLGFELGLDTGGAATRGYLRPSGGDVVELLGVVSRREMAAPTAPREMYVDWAAVVGSTTLPAAEMQALEEQDIVAIDDASYAADGLNCWLGAGPSRRYAGRAVMRRGGQLQMIEFTTKGRIATENPDDEAAAPGETGFAQIPVSLRFELARWDASLADVATLAAGAIIELGQRIDEQAVSVWVGQRCIGKGQLVAIGERLGVRLLSVFAQGP